MKPILSFVAAALSLVTLPPTVHAAGTASARAEARIPGLIRLTEVSDSIPDAPGSDSALPAVALPRVIVQLEDVLRRGPPAALRDEIERVIENFRRGLRALDEGTRDFGFAHLRAMMAAVAEAEAGLKRATDLAAAQAPEFVSLLVPAVQSAREAARRSGQDQIDHALAVGVPGSRLQGAQAAMLSGDVAFAAGAWGPAVQSYDEALASASATVAFSLDRLETNLHSVFDDASVGFSYVIGGNGVLLRSGGSGLARTAANPPARIQTSTTKMHVASVSKTLTAIVTLRLLHDLGLPLATAIGPYLPSACTVSPSFAAMRFDELMTHESGIRQLDPPGNTYEHLQELATRNVASKGFGYSNTNFSLLRVLIAGLMGVDPAQYGEFDAGSLTASAFLLQAHTLYAPIGVDYRCDPLPGPRTRQYNWPADGLSGYLEPPQSLACGGYGASVSSTELGTALAYLRYTSQLLAPADYLSMKSNYYGFMDPGHGYGAAQGVYGKNAGFSYPHAAGNGQCGVLKWAYENAWVPQ